MKKKILYKFDVAIIYKNKSKEPDIYSGYMATYKDALKRAFEMADAIAPEATIISIKKQEAK